MLSLVVVVDGMKTVVVMVVEVEVDVVAEVEVGVDVDADDDLLVVDSDVGSGIFVLGSKGLVAAFVVFAVVAGVLVDGDSETPTARDVVGEVTGMVVTGIVVYSAGLWVISCLSQMKAFAVAQLSSLILPLELKSTQSCMPPFNG